MSETEFHEAMEEAQAADARSKTPTGEWVKPEQYPAYMESASRGGFIRGARWSREWTLKALGYDDHEWKKYPGVITCKKCGLVKGSGFARCEPANEFLTPKPAGDWEKELEAEALEFKKRMIGGSDPYNDFVRGAYFGYQRGRESRMTVEEAAKVLSIEGYSEKMHARIAGLERLFVVVEGVLERCLHARQCNAPYGQTEKFPTAAELKTAITEIQETRRERHNHRN